MAFKTASAQPLNRGSGVARFEPEMARPLADLRSYASTGHYSIILELQLTNASRREIFSK
jgi:hypothetical protein